jgi:hypothetical protein
MPEVILAEITLSEVIVSVVILAEAGLSEIVMSVIIVSKVIMPEVSLPGIVMPVLVVMAVSVDVPATPVPHLVEPAPRRAIKATVGPHSGPGGVNTSPLISQAAKFPGRHLSRPHALVNATSLSQIPPAEVGAVWSRLSRETPQDETACQQAGHDPFSPDFHYFILRIL